MTDKDERKGIYLLPSLFTTAGLFFAFYSIIYATRGAFDKAAVGLLIAMIMDGLDGRVARMTNTTSEFGKEYDSLVDVIAFGLAPGIVMYFWSLQYLGKTGWLISFIYTASTALRLARFNTVKEGDKRYFFGLPCPAAAAFVVFWVWTFHEFEVSGSKIAYVSALITLLAAVLMVTSIRYRSFKDFDAKNRVPFVVLLIIACIFALIFFDPARVLFLLAAGYALSGPIVWILKFLKGEETWSTVIDSELDDIEEETENSSAHPDNEKPG